MGEIKEISLLKADEVVVRPNGIIINLQKLHIDFFKKYENDCKNARACSPNACWLLKRGICLSHLAQAKPQELYDLLEG